MEQADNKKIKGIILAGGSGSRLYPLTLCTSKQLLPVYDKPMIYYPISLLMGSGIKEILIISTKKDLPRFIDLLGDGKKLGISINYEIQDNPNGIAEALIIGAKFIGKDNVCLVLGDNIFYGNKLDILINQAKINLNYNFSTIFGVKVENPSSFGVIDFNDDGEIINITEKPKRPSSNFIVSGMYFYTNDVINYANLIKPSKRGELEITDINNLCLINKKLKCIKLDKDSRWSDLGTYSELIENSEFFRNLEKKVGFKHACIEEQAFNLGYISKKQLLIISDKMNNSSYGEYLKMILKKS